MGKRLHPCRHASITHWRLPMWGTLSTISMCARICLKRRRSIRTACHVLAIGYVSAHAQAAAFRRMETLLNEDELYIYRRGRNTKPTTVPRNADVQEYRCATGLEAVVGYLFLSGQYERLSQLMERVLAPQEKTV